MNHLFANVEIKGALKCTQDLLMEGRIEGDVTSTAQLTVGTQGFIKGTVHSHSVVVLGHVEGNITVQERCVVKSTATILGNITAAIFSIEEGATFCGHSQVQMSPPAANPPMKRQRTP